MVGKAGVMDAAVGFERCDDIRHVGYIDTFIRTGWDYMCRALPVKMPPLRDSFLNMCGLSVDEMKCQYLRTLHLPLSHNISTSSSVHINAQTNRSPQSQTFVMGPWQFPLSCPEWQAGPSHADRYHNTPQKHSISPPLKQSSVQASSPLSVATSDYFHW